MTNIIEDNLYKSAILLIRSRGIKFTVEELCKMVKISKKTFYITFPSKGDFALLVYKKAFNAFDKSLINGKGENLDMDIFCSFSDLLTITNEKTFNLYSMTKTIKDYALEEFKKREIIFNEYLNQTKVGKKYLNNDAFIISIKATLFSIGPKQDQLNLIQQYISFLEAR